jgi:murein DD-endopeptidase MepM/ murein hydrolase activator NlpD
MVPSTRRVKPGWYLLALLSVYALVATWAWRAAVAESSTAATDGVVAGRAEVALAGALAPIATVSATTPVGTLAATPAATGSLASASTAARSDAAPVVVDSLPATSVPATPLPAASRSEDAPAGLWWPIPGGAIPSDAGALPAGPQGAQSRREGFLILPENAGVPFSAGSPVIAVADGVIIRADANYREVDVLAWERFNRALDSSEADAARDRLLGRQLWLQLDDGRVVRYGHLAALRPGIAVGTRVERGMVIATAGNSGTLDAAAGRSSGVRLHLEIREGESFMGQGMSTEAVRTLARATFVGP